MKSGGCFLTNLTKLLQVKTVVTLAIVFVLCVKVMQGADISSEFVIIATSVITYYFCRDNAAEERVKKHEKDFH